MYNNIVSKFAAVYSTTDRAKLSTHIQEKRYRTMKKFIALLAAMAMCLSMLPAYADDGWTEVDDATELAAALSQNGNIRVMNNITLSNTIIIDKTVTIDLNDHTISAANRPFWIEGGHVTLTGTGIVTETTPYYAPFTVVGSANEEDTDYSYLNVGENITLSGWGGVFVQAPTKPGTSESTQTAYGVKLDIYGTLEGHYDATNWGGKGININGSITNTVNYPVINIYESANITAYSNENAQPSDDVTEAVIAAIGIYAAGYAECNIYGGNITGDTGIEMRAGRMNIYNGSISGVGNFYTEPNGSGQTIISPAVAISQHTTNLPIEVHILDGCLTSENGYALYEEDLQNDIEQDKIIINVSGGEFNGSANYGAVKFEDSSTINYSITGGTYNTDVGEYVSENYGTLNVDGSYTVAEKANASTNTVTINETNKNDIETAMDNSGFTAADGTTYQLDTAEVSGVTGNTIFVDYKFNEIPYTLKFESANLDNVNVKLGIVLYNIPSGTDVSEPSVYIQ